MDFLVEFEVDVPAGTSETEQVMSDHLPKPQLSLVYRLEARLGEPQSALRPIARCPPR
jgi:hypothetical protein